MLFFEKPMFVFGFAFFEKSMFVFRTAFFEKAVQSYIFSI